MFNFKIVPSGTLLATHDFENKNQFVDEKGQSIKANHLGHIYQIVDKQERNFSKWELLIRKTCYVALVFFKKATLGYFQPSLDRWMSIKETTYCGLVLEAEKEKIIKDYTPQMVNACGGLDAFQRKFQMNADWNGTVSLDLFPTPFTRGYLTSNAGAPPFVAFWYVRPNFGTNTKSAPYSKLEILIKEGKHWKHINAGILSDNQLCLGAQTVQIDTEAETTMLGRIYRLVNYKPIGEGKMTAWDRPYFEETPLNGQTDFFVYYPRQNAETWKLFEKHYPHQKVKESTPPMSVEELKKLFGEDYETDL